jgi:hypothetical protein
VYNYLKSELQKRGIPEQEICFASDAKNTGSRNTLFSQIRNGEKRIVIASTDKMGTGANVQTKLCAVHHLDIPWKPSQLEQRNGRILRQGNTFPKVAIYNYLTEGTFDSYLMNIIVNKQKFISQLMRGKTTVRSCSDVDETVLTYAEMQAIASGDSRIKERIDLEVETQRLHTLKNGHIEEIKRMKEIITRGNSQINFLENSLVKAKNDTELCKKTLSENENFTVKINGKILSERKEIGNEIEKSIAKIMIDGKDKTIGNIGDFELGIRKNKGMSNEVLFEIFVKNNFEYKAEIVPNNAVGNATRLQNLFENIPQKIYKIESQMQSTIDDVKSAELTVNEPFSHENELVEKENRLDELVKIFDKQAEIICDTDEENEISQPKIDISEDKILQEETQKTNLNKPKNPKL